MHQYLYSQFQSTSMAKLILISLIILSLSPLSRSLPSEAVLNAVETLSNSGYVAMSLTVQLTSETLVSQLKSATIFSPPDTAFAESGQPSLSLLQYHFSPLAFSVESLESLPFGTKIPTMSSELSLIVTTLDFDHRISLNNVTISGSPIYDDGSLIVFGIDNFFDPNFTVPAPAPSPSSDLGCVAYPKASFDAQSFHDASGMLKSRGYSVMASFLDLQLPGALGQKMLTVFAPLDNIMVTHAGNFPEYPSLFLRHVLPCKIAWIDLVNLGNGTELETYLEGFNLNITVSDTLMLNEIPVTFPDMYYSDWLVVHGIPDVLSPPQETTEQEGGSSSDIGSHEDPIAFAPDRGEF